MLDNDLKYYYKSSETFKNELDNVHGFVLKNYQIGMHMQEFFEINIVTSGNGTHYIEENCIDAETGDVFIIPPKVRHGYTGGEGFDVFHLLLSDKFIEKNMNELQMLPSFFILFTAEPLVRAKTEVALHLRLKKAQFNEVKIFLDRMLNFVKTTDPFSCILRSGIALAIISLFCSAYTENNEGDINKSSDTQFMNAISYIHENYEKKITIETLARKACLSRSSLVQRFKKICKMTPLEYITGRRIKAAEYMLLNTKFSLVDIAEKCGFYDVAHFSRSFVKHNAITPSAYRKNADK